MKKSTFLSKQLTKYGALTAAIVGVTDANGQSIVYTDIIPDFNGGVDENYFLDINNDGTNDFRVYTVGTYVYAGPLATGNSILGSGVGFAYPFALSSGAEISSGATSWFNNSNQSLNYSSCSAGNWCNVTDKYLGLRFNISGNTHYGWAQLDVSSNGNSWVVKGYAYHDTPNTSILAGKKSLSIEDISSIQDVKIVSLNKRIELYNLNGTIDYRLISLDGKSVLNGVILERDYIIEANSMSNGVYVIELTDTNSNTVIRKKVIL